MLVGRGRSTLLRFMLVLESRIDLAEADLGPRLDDEVLAVIYCSLLLSWTPIVLKGARRRFQKRIHPGYYLV